MKKAKLLVGILVLMTALTACGQKEGSTPPIVDIPQGSEAVLEPKEGGSMVIAASADPQNINPLYVIDQTSFDIQQAMYSPFFEIVKGQMFYGNGLCESITPNEDSSAFTLKLKENLKWHDGKPITAEDVVFTLEVLVDKKQNVPYQAYGFIDGKPVTATKVDELTAKIELASSSAGFLGGLSQIYCIPKHIYDGVENIGESALNNEPIGSGPFKFKDYRSGESFTVERFDDYFDGKPYLDSIIFKIVKDSNSANAALATGEINARLISSEDYDTVLKTGKVNINTYNSGRVNAMSFNQNVEALKDVKLRQAIAYALNKEELVNFAFLSNEFATPAYSVFTPDTLFYDSELTKYDNDVEKAKALLKEAGHTSLKLNILYISTNKAMESQALYIKEKLKEIGIELELLPMDESTYKNKVLETDTKDYDLVLQFYTLGEEPSLYADIMSSESRSNYSHIKDSVLDELWKKGNTLADLEEREVVYKDIQLRVNDNMYVYPIAYSNGSYAVDKNYGGFDKALLKTIYYDYSKIFKAK